MVFKKAPKTQDAPSDEDIPRLRSHEEFWSQIYDYLKGQGFQLRPRYQPNRKLKTREEQIPLALRSVMDAIQISEGRKVCLKLMKPEENLNIRELVTERSLTSDTGVVPILDFIPLPGTETQIAVMPYLRLFDDPKFETVGEVTEAISQYLEGLEYIHEHDMAHRDACWRNLMMDASELIPKGWHFARSWSQDGTKPIHSRKRSEVAVKYYFIDFELSVYADSSNPNPLASGIVGQDRTVPEFQSQDQEAKYNPFKLDIYQLGSAFKRRLLEHYDGLDLLIPLVEAMTSEAPSDRPSAKEARENLAKIVKDADLKSPISLKPGIKIWGSDPPRLETNSALRFVDSVRGWFSTKFAGLRQRWS